jgi:hypothetical protein
MFKNEVCVRARARTHAHTRTHTHTLFFEELIMSPEISGSFGRSTENWKSFVVRIS